MANRRTRWTHGARLWLLALGCVVHATNARAQSEGELTPEAPIAEPAADESAAPVANGSATPAPSESTADTSNEGEAWSEASRDDARLNEARGHVERGETLFDGGNFDAALAEFETAYALLEGHPAQALLLYNIGLCHERAFRYTRAMRAYRHYLEEAGADAEDRAKVEATVQALEGLLATLVIQVNTPAEVWVDERMIGSAPGSILVPGGRHTLELRAAGYESEKREIQLPAREQLELSWTLSKLSTDEGLSPVYFWSGVGATAAALVVGVGYGGSAMASSRNAKDDALPQANTDATVDTIRDKQLKADIFFAVAGGFAVGTAVIAIFTEWGDAPREPEPHARVRLRPLLGAGSLGLGGQF